MLFTTLRAPLAQSSKRYLSTSAKVASLGSSGPGITKLPVTGQTGKRDLAEEQRARVEVAHTAEVVSDAPPELAQRPVRIFRPNKAATTSGKAGTATWRVDWDILQGSGRWENPLMGWASSADYMQGTSLKFTTKEDAIHFCEKQGT